MKHEMSQEQYAESLFESDAVLEKVKASLLERGIRDISIAPGYGRLLTLLVKSARAADVLEIGALGGYSGICLARGLSPAGRLVSLELKPELAELAQSNLSMAGFGDQVEYRVGEALDSLQRLQEEGCRFDFFFIDADKGNYPNYLDWALKLARPGALIVGDNTFMRGKTTDPAEKGHGVTRMREFNERMAGDPGLDSVMLPAYDGLAIARVRETE
ncbi:Predicted O-methyltransferase YrrM [Paenibacillus sp. UNCCL117]|uniref:O-methyltransferase n=1 Tax=unclassified Paenibacillus TaxID=185978 RepID=UPI00088899E0|nr:MULTISPECIES: O-methyltransferase [unclassified Paenibacillus]SDC20581.1 Predicted O-methyltransferase YrrM [Paenibacillus sp. cl123]SFW18655.1 Predicted O-methyltransferase YrrM [Paenibacillus sp. UNCCL117]